MLWTIPRAVVEQAVGELSRRNAEVFALWTAPLGGSGRCAVARVVVPRQEAYDGAHGACVHVPGEELRRIAFDNYRRGERNAAQIHTHPSDDTRMSALAVVENSL